MAAVKTAVPPIIALDMDGTVFTSDHKTVTPRTYSALAACAARGAQIVPVTGRCEGIVTLDALPPVRYLITCNGGIVKDRQTGAILWADTIPWQHLEKAWEILREYDVVPQLFVGGDIVLERRVYEDLERYRRQIPVHHLPYLRAGRGIVVDSLEQYIRTERPQAAKINLPGKNLESCPQVVERLRALDLFEISSDGMNLEATNRGCNKGKALQGLCAHLNVSPSQVAAFGDGHNDIPMLSAVGWGVAMGNAKPAVREAAAYQTGPNTEDGIADFLHQYWEEAL